MAVSRAGRGPLANEGSRVVMWEGEGEGEEEGGMGRRRAGWALGAGRWVALGAGRWQMAVAEPWQRMNKCSCMNILE